MKGNPIIGSNLYLRKSCFDDCLYFAVWEARPEVSSFFTIDDGRDYQQTVREYIERKKRRLCRQWTICAIADDRPVGRIYVSSINKHYDSLDITRIYIADTNDRGRGYGREAWNSYSNGRLTKWIWKGSRWIILPTTVSLRPCTKRPDSGGKASCALRQEKRQIC